GALRLFFLDVAPDHGAQLHFDQFAQAAQLVTYSVERTLRLGLSARTRLFHQRCGKHLVLRSTIAFAANGQLDLSRGDHFLGFAQLSLQLQVRFTQQFTRQLIIQRRHQFHAAGNTPIADNRGIHANIIAFLLHGLWHVVGEESFDLHALLPSVNSVPRWQRWCLVCCPGLPGRTARTCWVQPDVQNARESRGSGRPPAEPPVCQASPDVARSRRGNVAASRPCPAREENLLRPPGRLSARYLAKSVPTAGPR